jgi:hypothetical protein
MNAVRKQCAVSVMAVAVLLLAGCTQSTKPPVSDESVAGTKPAGPPQLVTSKTAFGVLYKSALNWTPDVVILKLVAKEVPGFKNEVGKAAMWEATFASPSLHRYRVDTYSIATVLPGIHKGGTAGFPLPWGGVTRDTMPIDPSNFNVDSDAAYTAAAADAAAWLKKNPDKKLAPLELGNVFKLHALVWYVMWGDQKSGYIAFVDAGSGKVLKGK